ncbi:MAG: metallophosphoesterase [Bacteroidales bacterium]|nr:metallophosphoesterase [Bacteroidales bacterium]
MDRRHFIRSMAGAGAVITTSQLPVLAEDKPEEFPKRGRYERLSLSYATVKIGLKKPFSVLHLSDSHLTETYAGEDEWKRGQKESRTRTFGGRQEEALKDAIAWAKEHVDYIVHTGDLIDYQSEANFDLVGKYFGDKMFGSLGNHEFIHEKWNESYANEKYKDGTRRQLKKVYPFDISLHSQVVNDVNFVTMDDVFGYVTKDQVRQFKKEVKKKLPIVLCMHVPFFTENIWRATCRFWKDNGPMTEGKVPPASGDYLKQQEDKTTKDFIAYLKKEPLLKCILAGHEHITVEDQFSATCREYLVAGGFLFHGREVMFV